jgi:hypothetical protein
VADNYTTISSRQTIQVVSQTQSADVQAVTIQTVPSGIRMDVLVPLAAWQAGKADDYLSPPATIVEGLVSSDHVTSGSFVQDTDASGLLAGFLNLTVTYVPSGSPGLPFNAIVQVPMTALASDDDYTAWAKAQPGGHPFVTAYDNLKATANL